MPRSARSCTSVKRPSRLTSRTSSRSSVSATAYRRSCSHFRPGLSTAPTPEDGISEGRGEPDQDRCRTGVRIPLLQTGPNRGDASGVEAEPMHPTDVACMFDLQTTIHDDGDTTGLGDLSSFGVDHPELAPEGAGV